MTEADIPLRDQIRDELERVIAKIMQDWDEGGEFAQYEELGWRYSEIMADIAAAALLAAFDITPRGSLPVNEEPQTQ